MDQSCDGKDAEARQLHEGITKAGWSWWTYVDSDCFPDCSLSLNLSNAQYQWAEWRSKTLRSPTELSFPPGR